MIKVFNTHPLDLHEIRSRIATKLDEEDLVSCARVSRDWNDSFTPLLYSSIVLSCSGPSVESLRKNKHLVQHLTVHGTADVDLFHIQGLDRLTTVRFADSLNFYCNVDDEDRSRIGQSTSEKIAGSFLFNNSRSLRSIDIGRGWYCAEFWNSVAICGALKEVRMLGDDISLYGTSFVPFLKSCSQLDSLSLRLPRLIETKVFEQLLGKLSTEDVPWRSTVKHLTNLNRYLYDRDDLYDRDAPWWPILGHWFPDLERLDAGYSRNETYLENLCRVMEAGTWKKLRSFSLEFGSARDSHLNVIIGSMVDIQRLVLSDRDLGPVAFSKLEKHFLTLRELEISASSAHLVAILESCPLLEVFKGARVLFRDFTPGRKWPCSSRLRAFTLAVELDCLPTGEPGEDHSIQSESLCRLLSHLVKVETLDLKRFRVHYGQFRTNEWLDFSLESGLSHLHGLKELKSVVLPGCQKLGKLDALWMVKHWTRLSVIAGMVHVFMEELMEIREVFKAGGVSVALSPRKPDIA